VLFPTCVNPSCARRLDRLDEYPRNGECHACAEYRRRFGRVRPYTEDGRSERFGKRPVIHPEEFDTGIRIGRVVGMGRI